MRRTKESGFSLLELLIVIAVIAIIAGIALPSFRGMRDEASVTEAESELKVLQAAVESYYRHVGKYPTSLKDLYTAKPNIVRAELDDPFTTSGNTYGYDYKIAKDGSGNYIYVIYSYGPDGRGKKPTVKNNNTNKVYLYYSKSGDTSDDLAVSNVDVVKK